MNPAYRVKSIEAMKVDRFAEKMVIQRTMKAL